MCDWRRWFRVLLAASALLLFAACPRHERPGSLAQSLRCGMTRAEVKRLAHQYGYDRSDESWLTRSVTKQSMKSKQLSHVDLRFHGDRLVGLREGRYDPGTKHVVYRDIDLCASGSRVP